MLSYTIIFYARIEISRWGVLSDFVHIYRERESIGERKTVFYKHITTLKHLCILTYGDFTETSAL